MNALYTIRRAVKTDVPSLAKLHVDTFHETHGNYPGSPDFDLRLNQWQKIFEGINESWFCLLVQDDKDNLIGFAKGQRYQHGELPQYHGELNKLYLLRKYQGLGLGRRLLIEVASEFDNMGISSMLLFGDANSPSNGFYEHLGGEKLYSSSGEFHGGYGWRSFEIIFRN